MALLRVDPGNDAAQELALTAAVAAVADHSIVVESGVDRGVAGLSGEDLTLPGRMRARQIDLMRVAAGAPPEELLRVARALSHDTLPVPSTAAVRMEMVPTLTLTGLSLVEAADFSPPRGESDRRSWVERRTWRAEPWRGVERRRAEDRRISGERRLRLVRYYEMDVARLQARLGGAVATGAWTDVLDSAHRLLGYAPRVPVADRRSYVLGLRRYFPRHALDALIALALRDAAEQPRVADVLRAFGLEAADAMVEVIHASTSSGPRKFLQRVLATMPEAYPAVLPLLRSPEPRDVMAAAGILAAMRRPESLAPLRQRLEHDNAGVRRAILLALAAFPADASLDLFAGALGHASPDTRGAAAEAIGLAHATAMAMPLVAALDGERDAQAWSAMVAALGRLATAESCTALAAVALSRRRLVGRGGYPADRRLQAVRALARATTPHREAALQRVAREGDGPVRAAAAAALARGTQAAG